jgi:Glycosyl hydrolases family 38 N-terminal domain
MSRRVSGMTTVAVVWLAVLAAPCPAAPPVERIYIVHFSHTDFGFTDLQSVCRELQQRYLDIAVDGVLATKDGPPEKKFYWTAESIVAVDDWWKAAAPERRRQFVEALRGGQLEVAAMPFNQTPFLDEAQWRTMLHWLPDDVWQQVRPVVAVQNDVNGFPRAGASALLDRGITRLMMGINADSGGPPFFRPSAFWWKQPDGRRLFVWLNLSYPDGYDFFETAHWRRGPVPGAADTRYRPPRAGDFFRTDEASLRVAQAQCVRRIEQLQRGGYPYNVLTISMTNHWRMDNDPPFLPLPEFVAAWNKLGLKPELVFTTVSKALEAMEQAVGTSIRASSPTGGPTARPPARAKWRRAGRRSALSPPSARLSGVPSTPRSSGGPMGS